MVEVFSGIVVVRCVLHFCDRVAGQQHASSGGGFV